MTDPVHLGIRIVWGSGYCPGLPEGYTLIRGIARPARARDAAGQEYLIALHPNRLAKIIERGRADFTTAIPF